MIDVGEPLVKATYYLEGDAPLALNCFEMMTSVLPSIQTECYTNVKEGKQKTQ